MVAAISEESPLVYREEDVIYSRFTNAHKRFIVALVSWCGLLTLFVSGTFIPSIPEIARELGSTEPIISLAVSLSICATALGVCTWASYSTYYGRRTVFLYSLPMLIVASTGVALSDAVPELLFWRFFQAFGAAGGLSVGAGVLGDIYRVEERGLATGIFMGVSLLGPALAPMAGGIAAQYASWRLMQLLLGCFGLVGFVAVLFAMPETNHKLVLNKMGEQPEKRPWKFINPVGSLALLKSPTLLLACLAGTTALFTDYLLLIPISRTIGIRYGITNHALIGACFLPEGLGNIIGAPIAGRLSDYAIIKARRARGGAHVAEDRLRSTLSGALIFVPFSVIMAGVAIEYVDGPLGLAIVLACFFINGFGIDLVTAPLNAYCIDAMPGRSAEAVAANMGFRSILIACSTTMILPSIDTIGVLSTNAIGGALSILGYFCLVVTIRYGERLRGKGTSV